MKKENRKIFLIKSISVELIEIWFYESLITALKYFFD